MDYTIKDGQYYKIVDEQKNVILGMFADSATQLSTIHDVEFLTKEQYIELGGVILEKRSIESIPMKEDFLQELWDKEVPIVGESEEK